ncbi:MAG: signal recognition particle-docking protein FtsY [Chloroflexi bacterium]|nr:signal recognition particle-docking protein FtsY [Chloroflexota bacterium]
MLRRFLRRDKEKEKEKTEQAVKKTRQTWFGRMTTLFQRSNIDDELWDELEELLISADVGVATTQKILDHLRERIREEHITQPNDALEALKREMVSILEVDKADDLLDVEELPLILLVVGVNGVGKTTSIAKLTQMFKDEGKSVVLGAADTFRAAAIEQLQAWGSRLEVDVIAHQSGADPGSVAFDTLHAAKSRNTDVVIIDTAGRLHTKLNLMEELKKIQRVLSRQGGESQRVLLTLDATTGQNGLFQARSFVDAVKCDGVFLAKLDGTAKGGIVLAITDELKLPVLYIGTGEQPDDIAVFDPSEFIESLFATNARD